jgi:hypothetical protein
MRLLSRLESDKGASMALVAVSLLLLLGASAIAVDLAAMRLDRSADQKVTDSAASAGALAALEGTGQDACVAALDYVAINSEGIGSIDTTGCALDIPTTCDPVVPESHFVSTGRFDITFTYPVDDGNDLMTSAQLGAPTQKVVADDGDPCERVGVEMSATHDSLFAQLLGFDQGTTTVHSVARSFLPPPDGPPINLLLLDRFGCEVMKASGSSNAGIIVDEIVDPATGEVFPGEGAVDSDASVSGGCPSDGGTIDVDGSNATIRADGPPNCGPWENPIGSGQGCGFLRTLAPGTPGCNWPACTAGGAGPNVPNPPPTALSARITRAPVDHRYNCRTDGYSTADIAWSWAADALTTGNEQNIPDCEGPHDPRIHDLISNVGPSGLPSGTFTGSWQTWSSLHPDCSVDPGQGFSITGNVWVDCGLLEIKDTVTITDGSLVLDGELGIASNGHLIMNNDASDGLQRFLFMRDGLFRKEGQASLTLNETMVYLSKRSRVRMAGGSTGTLTWIAPDEDGHPFDDLALWSDSTVTSAPHAWEGQAGLKLEGVFFVPIVTVEYAGQGSQIQVKAQFIADKLHARGQGELVVAPVAGRAVDLKSIPRTTLIR